MIVKFQGRQNLSNSGGAIHIGVLEEWVGVGVRRLYVLIFKNSGGAQTT